MKIHASAPAKTILFGEHYAVYGAPGVVVAIEPRNSVEVSITDSDEPGLEYNTTRTESCIKRSAQLTVTTNHPINELYTHYLKTYRGLREMRICATVKKAWSLKGVGNSASLSACFAYGTRKALGLGTSAKDIFEDTQIAESAAHGTPSGIDAAAVCYGGVLAYEKRFARKPSIKKLGFCAPEDFSFLLIDTYSKDKKRSNTRKMIEKFAQSHAINRPAHELRQEEREKIIAPYMSIYKRAKRALERANAPEIARCMNENHALLRDSKVSSKSIENAIGISLNNGAVGAKMTAAGGIGGAAIALCKKSRLKKLRSALLEKGFESFEFKISERGVGKK